MRMNVGVDVEGGIAQVSVKYGGWNVEKVGWAPVTPTERVGLQNVLRRLIVADADKVCGVGILDSLTNNSPVSILAQVAVQEMELPYYMVSKLECDVDPLHAYSESLANAYWEENRSSVSPAFDPGFRSVQRAIGVAITVFFYQEIESALATHKS